MRTSLGTHNQVNFIEFRAILTIQGKSWKKIQNVGPSPSAISGKNNASYVTVGSTKIKLRGYHKIKHFACHRDFFVHQIPRIKHTKNASFPGIERFRASHWLKIGCFIPGYEAFCVCFIRGI